MPFSVRLLYKSVITKPPSFNEITMFANTYVLQTAFDGKEIPTSCLCPKSTSRFLQHFEEVYSPEKFTLVKCSDRNLNKYYWYSISTRVSLRTILTINSFTTGII